jgi:flagellin-like hook-associated protein FlgL
MLVMLAGVLGLVLSLAGLVAIWVYKPMIADSANQTIVTLNSTVTTSQKTMQITGQALGATIDSVDALSTMLSTTAISVEDTQPVLDQFNIFLGDVLPSTLESATSSLETAQQAAVVLDSAITSLDTFRAVLSGVPLIGGLIDQPTQAYNPEVPLAKSLGELAANLEALPELFTGISEDMDKADDNLVTIKSNLTTMSDSVGLISESLSEYEVMITQSESSMDDVKLMLVNIQDNLTNILNGAAIVLSLFFFWLLAAQIVIFSQGWELYQGTTDRMEGGEAEPLVTEVPES